MIVFLLFALLTFPNKVLATDRLKKAAIYVRVSTDMQAEKGYSIDTQLEACRKAARELGANSIQEFVDDGYSGEYIDRPAMEQLRKGVKAKEFDIVIVYDPDRLARNLAHQLIITEEIEQSGAQLKFVSVTFEQSPEGKLFYSIRGAVSAYEKEKIKERTMRGKRGKLESGKLVFNPHTYGFDWDTDKCMYVIKENEAKVIRLIYDLCINEHLGTRAIAIRLNEMAIPTARNTIWNPGTVYKILNNEVYHGTHYGLKYYHKKTGLKEETRIKRDRSEWIPVNVPAILDKETWEKAQNQLQINKSRSTRNTKRDYLLQHLLYCSRCKRPISVYYSGTGRKEYYWCNSHREPFHGQGCGARMIKVDIVEDFVWEHVVNLCTSKQRLGTYIKAESGAKDQSGQQQELKRLAEQEKKLIKQREAIMKWFSQQMISDDEAEKQLSDIKTKMLTVVTAMDKIKESININQSSLSTSDIVSRFKQSYHDNMTKQEKKILMLEIIDKIYMERTDSSWGSTELNMSIVFK